MFLVLFCELLMDSLDNARWFCTRDEQEKRLHGQNKLFSLQGDCASTREAQNCLCVVWPECTVPST